MAADNGKRAEILESEYEALYSVRELLRSRRDYEMSMYGAEAGYLEEICERTEKLLMKIVREQRGH